MDNKYNETDIDVFINSQSLSFKCFLDYILLDEKSLNILNRIALQTDVYIFSGVIRNFFLGYSEFRDLDIVVKDIDQIKLPIEYVRKIRIKRNSFGGYKLNLEHLNLDVWGLEKTWGIVREKKKSNVSELISSAFFNFSAIAFDYNKSKFVYNKDFIEFIKTKTINIVYDKNPNIALCIVNTMYYREKYDLRIGLSLCKWIVNNYNSNVNYSDIQIKHFNKIMYTNDSIDQFIHRCSSALIYNDKKNSK